MKWLSDHALDHLRTIVATPDFSATKYRVVKELARGGMGTVYLAEDPELDRQIAIKVLNTPEISDETTKRMVREAQIIARLEHPGIVPVHDVGVLPDGRVFYAMKLVRGHRLDEYAAKTKSIKERLRKFQAACDAVAFAHSHGVVHRDLKPQNIMIGAFGEVLVLDWGVAKLMRQDLGSEANTLELRVNREHLTAQPADDTTHGTIIGTPHFMAPEQARGEVATLDERADVYSLGAVLFFLLTDQLPAKAGNQPTIRPRSIDPKISKAAEAVCLKAMAADAVARYASADELARDVGHLLDVEPVSAYRENTVELVGRWLSKNRFLVFLVLAYLLMRLFFILTARR